MGALRQGWRVKQHPLQTVEDLRPLIKSLPQLPVEDLISRVIDLIEDRSRRIVDVDCDTNSLVRVPSRSCARVFFIFRFQHF